MPHHLSVRYALAACASAVLLAGCNVQLSLQAEAKDQWKKTYTLAEGGTLDIRNTNGLITVESATGNTVEITADRVVRAVSDEAAKDALAKWDIEQSATPDHVTIDSGRQNGVNLMVNQSRRADYHVRAPQWANLRLETTNGTIDLTGPRITGIVRAQTTNGNIKAVGLENGTTVGTTNGRVTIGVTRLGDDGLSCETTNGSIAVTVPPDVNARLSARVTNGAITADVPKTTTYEDSRRRLDANIGSGGPPIRLETTNGAISITTRK